MQTHIDAGSVIGRAFNIYKEQAGVLIPVALGLFLVVGVLGGLAGATLFLLPIYFVVAIVAHILFQGMVIALVRDVQDGRRDYSPGELIQSVVPVVVPLFLVALVAGLLTLLGFALLILPGFFLVTAWFVIAPVVVVERTGPIAALGRSWQLVKPHFWQVFLTIFLLFLIVFAASFVLGIIGAIFGDVGRIVLNVVASALTAPIWALTATVTYFALRGDTPAPAGDVAVTPETSVAPPPPPPPPASPQV